MNSYTSNNLTPYSPQKNYRFHSYNLYLVKIRFDYAYYIILLIAIIYETSIDFKFNAIYNRFYTSFCYILDTIPDVEPFFTI
jgi:hypothetical protein